MIPVERGLILTGGDIDGLALDDDGTQEDTEGLIVFEHATCVRGRDSFAEQSIDLEPGEKGIEDGKRPETSDLEDRAGIARPLKLHAVSITTELARRPAVGWYFTYSILLYRTL